MIECRSKLGRELACLPILPIPVLVALSYSHESRMVSMHGYGAVLQFLYFKSVSSFALSPVSLSLCGRVGLLGQVANWWETAEALWSLDDSDITCFS